eukprot:symbB.v1.2.040591.t1/scaffold7282.1/size12121/1
MSKGSQEIRQNRFKPSSQETKCLEKEHPGGNVVPMWKAVVSAGALHTVLLRSDGSSRSAQGRAADSKCRYFKHLPRFVQAESSTFESDAAWKYPQAAPAMKCDCLPGHLDEQGFSGNSTKSVQALMRPSAWRRRLGAVLTCKSLAMWYPCGRLLFLQERFTRCFLEVMVARDQLRGVQQIQSAGTPHNPQVEARVFCALSNDHLAEDLAEAEAVHPDRDDAVVNRKTLTRLIEELLKDRNLDTITFKDFVNELESALTLQPGGLDEWRMEIRTIVDKKVRKEMNRQMLESVKKKRKIAPDTCQIKAAQTSQVLLVYLITWTPSADEEVSREVVFERLRECLEASQVNRSAESRSSIEKCCVFKEPHKSGKPHYHAALKLTGSTRSSPGSITEDELKEEASNLAFAFWDRIGEFLKRSRTCSELSPDEKTLWIQSGLALSPLMGTCLQYSLDFCLAWALIGEWTSKVLFPVPKHPWPRHGHAGGLVPLTSHRGVDPCRL